MVFIPISIDGKAENHSDPMAMQLRGSMSSGFQRFNRGFGYHLKYHRHVCVYLYIYIYIYFLFMY